MSNGDHHACSGQISTVRMQETWPKSFVYMHGADAAGEKLYS